MWIFFGIAGGLLFYFVLPNWKYRKKDILPSEKPGALIAFQILTDRVTSPLVRLVGLIYQYQEAALSVEKLGVVMNAREE